MFNYLKNLLKLNKTIVPEENIVRDWQLISKSYAPPRRLNTGLEGLPKEIQEKALLGVTAYLWQDRNTGELRRKELPGSDNPVLEELFVKVKQFGPQHIKDENGEIFILSKYVPQQVDPLALPRR